MIKYSKNHFKPPRHVLRNVPKIPFMKLTKIQQTVTTSKFKHQCITGIRYKIILTMAALFITYGVVTI